MTVHNFTNITKQTPLISITEHKKRPCNIPLEKIPCNIPLEIEVKAWDRYKNVAGLNRLIESHPPPAFRSPMTINIKNHKRHVEICF